MVVQNPLHHFLAKTHEFFGDQTTPERHRSGVVHSTFRHRSDVVHATVQAGSTGTILICLNNAFCTAVCLKTVVHPGASCWFLENSIKIIFCSKDIENEH